MLADSSIYASRFFLDSLQKWRPCLFWGQILWRREKAIPKNGSATMVVCASIHCHVAGLSDEHDKKRTATLLCRLWRGACDVLSDSKCFSWSLGMHGHQQGFQIVHGATKKLSKGWRYQDDSTWFKHSFLLTANAHGWSHGMVLLLCFG